MKLICYCMAICLLFSCKEELVTSDMIIDVTADPESVLADGSTTITLTAFLNNNLNKRKVSFESDKGSFVGSQEAGKILVDAEKIENILQAVAKLKAPSAAGPITVKIQMDIADLKGMYVVTKVITANPSIPATIKLTASAFNVHNNFDGEIQLTGAVKNVTGGGVSQGTKVILQDLKSDLSPGGGAFRSESLSSNSSSQISAFYSPGAISAGDFVYVTATVLDDAGNKTFISDTIKIYVTEKTN